MEKRIETERSRIASNVVSDVSLSLNEKLPITETSEDLARQHLEMVILKRKRCQEWVSSLDTKKFKQPKCEQGKHCTSIQEQKQCLENPRYKLQDVKSEKSDHTWKKTKSNSAQEVVLHCEWRDCNAQCVNTNEFSAHVATHVLELEVVLKGGSPMYLCLWDECDFETSNSKEAERHVCYHAYHAKLKVTSAQLNASWDFPVCKLDNSARNCLPELLTPFVCEWSECEFVAENVEKFFQHVNQHVTEVELSTRQGVNCSWKGCTMQQVDRTIYRVHMRKHTGEKVAGCATCGAMFSTNTKYKDHCVRKNHSNDENNRCKFCWRYFASVRLLRDHMRYHINTHRCCFCEMTCNTPSRLASHIQYRHMNERHFLCYACSFRCKTLDDFNSHMLTHVREPQFRCNSCDFKCRNKSTLKNHYQNHHSTEPHAVYACHLCNKTYNRGSYLTSHLQKSHNIERPSGHSRFRYMRGADGLFKLQIERYESVETQNFSRLLPWAENDTENLKYVIKPVSCEEFCTAYCIEKENECPSTKGASGRKVLIEEVDDCGNVIQWHTVEEQMVDSIPDDGIVIATGDDTRITVQ